MWQRNLAYLAFDAYAFRLLLPSSCSQATTTAPITMSDGQRSTYFSRFRHYHTIFNTTRPHTNLHCWHRICACELSSSIIECCAFEFLCCHNQGIYSGCCRNYAATYMYTPNLDVYFFSVFF